MEAVLRAVLAADEKRAEEHPVWAAYAAWARQEQSVFLTSRRQWRAQSPAIDVAALEDAYELSPAALTISAVGERSGAGQS